MEGERQEGSEGEGGRVGLGERGVVELDGRSLGFGNQGLSETPETPGFMDEGLVQGRDKP